MNDKSLSILKNTCSIVFAIALSACTDLNGIKSSEITAGQQEEINKNLTQEESGAIGLYKAHHYLRIYRKLDYQNTTEKEMLDARKEDFSTKQMIEAGRKIREVEKTKKPRGIMFGPPN